MAENPKLAHLWFYLKHKLGLRAVLVFDRFWNATSEEPECTVLNVQRLNLHLQNLDYCYKEIHEAYHQLVATGNAEKTAIHAPEYEAFVDRYKEIKAIQKRPEWKINQVHEQLSPSECEATWQNLSSLIRSELYAADLDPVLE